MGVSVLGWGRCVWGWVSEFLESGIVIILINDDDGEFGQKTENKKIIKNTSFAFGIVAFIPGTRVQAQARGPLVGLFEVGYHSRKKKKKKHVIRVSLFFFSRPSNVGLRAYIVQGCKNVQNWSKGCVLVMFINFGKDMTEKLRLKKNTKMRRRYKGSIFKPGKYVFRAGR